MATRITDKENATFHDGTARSCRSQQFASIRGITRGMRVSAGVCGSVGQVADGVLDLLRLRLRCGLTRCRWVWFLGRGKMALRYEWMPGSFALSFAGLIPACSALYGSHYGKWAANSPINPGESIRLSPAQLRRWFDSKDSKLACAWDGEKLIGYAISIRTKVPRMGVVSWVTQLVVHEDYRQQGVAKSLLFAGWNFSDHYAWGLVSANPFAIRALEKATRRRCDPLRVKRSLGMLKNVARSHIAYIPDDPEIIVGDGESSINTHFFVDHSLNGERIELASAMGQPWTMGSLEQGWEWFAFTFKDQDPIQLTELEIDAMIQANDEVVRQAYSRMTLDENHGWAKHASSEVEFIIRECNLRVGSTVLDLGCGAGRHAVELAKHGIRVVGVDYSQGLIDRAIARARAATVDVASFIKGDCRDVALGERFDAVICLYDVIGSYAEKSENLKIIRNIKRYLRPGGHALVSVMNMVLTSKVAKQRFSFKSEPARLQELTPSHTMEMTGNIFDPDYFLLDEAEGVVYRKEQFDKGTELPTELIVRDRRYTPKEISDLLFSVGLAVHWTRCVRSGQWDATFEPDDGRAKEILVLCELR